MILHAFVTGIGGYWAVTGRCLCMTQHVCLQCNMASKVPFLGNMQPSVAANGLQFLSCLWHKPTLVYLELLAYCIPRTAYE